VQSSNRKPAPCNCMPEDLDYLGAPLSCLKTLVNCNGKPMPQSFPKSRLEISRDLYWALHGNPFPVCDHEEGSNRNCWYGTEVLQEIEERTIWGDGGSSEENSNWKSMAVPLSGAVVFRRKLRNHTKGGPNVFLKNGSK
jgi:hypothetical protein